MLRLRRTIFKATISEKIEVQDQRLLPKAAKLAGGRADMSLKSPLRDSLMFCYNTIPHHNDIIPYHVITHNIIYYHIMSHHITSLPSV